MDSQHACDAREDASYERVKCVSRVSEYKAGDQLTKGEEFESGSVSVGYQLDLSNYTLLLTSFYPRNKYYTC